MFCEILSQHFHRLYYKKQVSKMFTFFKTHVHDEQVSAIGSCLGKL